MLAALAHPTRRHILQVLAARDGTLTAGELTSRFAHSWPTTTRHLGVLLDAGLVRVTPVGRERRYEFARHRLGDVLALWLGSVGFGLRTLRSGEAPAVRDDNEHAPPERSSILRMRMSARN